MSTDVVSPLWTARARPLSFFEFNQNNSKGVHTFDEVRGISVVVIVQAADWHEANYRAERIGLYFNEFRAGDCGCCGERWTEQWSGSHGTPVPTVYGEPLDVWMSSRFFRKWMMSDQPEVFVHLVDGTFRGFVYGTRGAYRVHEALMLEG